MSRVRDFFVVPTRFIEPRSYRTYITFNLGCVTALGVHLSLLPLFVWLGAYELLWVNVFSGAAYLGALWANRRGWHTTTIAVALLELSVHQAFCVLLLGWDTAFQYYLLVVPTMVFFLPAERLIVKVGLVLLAAAVYGGLYVASRGQVPVHTIAPQVAIAIAAVNITAVFGLLGLFGYNYRRAAEEAEERLAATERRLSRERLLLLRAAVQAAQDVIVIVDADGRIVFVNEAFTRTTGFEAHDVLGAPLGTLSAAGQADPSWETIWAILRAGQSWSGRLESRRQDSSDYSENATITPIVDEDGAIRHYVAIKQDITADLEASERLANTQAQLRQAQRLESIGRLAGGVAHDFNNLLTTILTNCSFMLEELDRGSTSWQDAYDIQRSARRAAALTSQLLAYSRKQVLSPEVMDLNRAVQDLEPLLRRTIVEQVHLSLSLGPDLLRIEADAGQMGQVLINLVVNAADAMSEGGTIRIVTEDVHTEQPIQLHDAAVPPGRYVRLAVEDTGHGIPPAVLQSIFEPFFTTKEQGRGTGLGLSMVYGIVKQTGGFIGVESQVGQGTTFSIYLPATERPPAPSASAPPRARPQGCETLLLVEDDADVRGVVVRTLESCGYQLLVAGNGPEALALLEEHTGVVDLMVTDIMMPGMDGATLAAKVRALYPSVLVIYASGYPGEVIEGRGAFVPGQNFIGKPFTPDQLASFVRQVLDR